MPPSTPAGAEPHARVLEIQRMSTEDGPGIRTTVFFKGCSLACTWCHNPESIATEPQLVWHEVRCIGCRTCVEECEHQARQLTPEGAKVDAARCTGCASCAEACPSLAIEQLGRDWPLEELMAELAKDRSYYETSGGGVTLSGGEPVLVRPYAAKLLASCRQAGIHTALDTCGLCSPAGLLELGRAADLVLYDLKEIDDAKHRRFTAQSNERILANAIALAEHLQGAATELWIRTPVIPGATAREDNLRGIGAFIAERLGPKVTRWELCAFNNLCGAKYERLGTEWRFAATPLLTATELHHYADVARSSGVDPAIVHADGPTRIADQAVDRGSSPGPCEEEQT